MIDVRLGSASTRDNFPWDTINALGPHIIWFSFLIFLLFWIGRDNILNITTNVEKINFAGFEVYFRHVLEQAAASRGKELPAADAGHASRRLAQSIRLVNDAKILWIDDQPLNNRLEKKLLEDAGARVDVRRSSEEAERALECSHYDLILSDIARPGDDKAGLKFADALPAGSPHIILYVTQVKKPVPASVFGITQRPDELIHLVLDVLARTRS